MFWYLLIQAGKIPEKVGPGLSTCGRTIVIFGGPIWPDPEDGGPRSVESFTFLVVQFG